MAGGVVGKKPFRLPPLNVLRVRNPNRSKEGQPCAAALSSVLACWASTGQSSTVCATVEKSLRECMDARKPPPSRGSTINYHLHRFAKDLTQQKKKK